MDPLTNDTSATTAVDLLSGAPMAFVSPRPWLQAPIASAPMALVSMSSNDIVEPLGLAVRDGLVAEQPRVQSFVVEPRADHLP